MTGQFEKKSLSTEEPGLRRTNPVSSIFTMIKELNMKDSSYKKLKTSGHFPDFWHTAKGQRDNKKIRAQMERRQLNQERMDIDAEQERNGAGPDVAQEQDG